MTKVAKNNIERQSETFRLDKVERVNIISCDDDLWRMEICLREALIFTKKTNLKATISSYALLCCEIHDRSILMTVGALEDAEKDLNQSGKDKVESLIKGWSE